MLEQVHMSLPRNCTLQGLQQLLYKDMGDTIHLVLPVSWAGKAEETEAQKAKDSGWKPTVEKQRQLKSPILLVQGF